MAAVTRTPTAYLVIAELAHVLTMKARSVTTKDVPRQLSALLDAVIKLAMEKGACPSWMTVGVAMKKAIVSPIAARNNVACSSCME